MENLSSNFPPHCYIFNNLVSIKWTGNNYPQKRKKCKEERKQDG